MAARLYQLKALQQNTLSLPTKEYGHSRVARSDKMADKVKFCFELPDQGSNELWSRFESMSKVVVSLYAVEERMNTTFLTAPGAVKSLCRLQTRFEGLPGYRQLCSKASLTDVNSACCPIWSLANFIASIVNKTSCHQITEGDVKRVKNLYETCKKPFLSGELKRACWDATAPSRWLCPDVPPQCFAHPHLLLLLAIAAPPPYHHHYLNGAGGWNVTLLVLPVWKRVGLKLWHLASLDRPQTLTDLTRNLTPPLTIEIWVSIHPRNDCCGDVATDEGSGDEKAARLRLRAQRMADTLRHAVPSVCLTSLSTLGGLLVSLNSAIVAVKRFSVYASLTVLCHVVYVLAVMPTLLLLFVPPHRRRCCHFLRPLRLPRFCLADLLVIKMRFTFPLLLLSVIVTSAYLLFHAGWLTFPFGPLQPAFYRPAHPAEVYRLRGGEFSWAEYTLRSHRSLISLHLVWGVQPHDPRNHWTWTPYDNDVVVPQPLWREDFNLTTPVSLSWLSAFCSEITKMPRSFAPPSILPRSSFLEEDALLLSQNYGCVFGRSVFSFRDFNESTPMCYQNTASCLTAFAEASSIPTGMRFSLDTARIVGLVISATVNFSLANTTFSAVQEFTQHVETWFSTLLATAPNGLLAIIRSNGNEDASWKRRCQRALGTVGWAVTGAALSTALAGSAVLPSHLKCYQQMGLFLLILMTSALLLCGIAFVGSVACLPDKCIMACWRNRETTNAAVS
ncbi:Protein dispatched [Echinococcus granulosus]|uniref:Protein dispatched n=1 Tax=Echinococcus granulosus TaxID=6210 RepID=W6UJI6_ECHGR|nr:Protein dispatched [Echinococcus granulosus]EUB61680.1 Protein dispatched [Echinococcus granulosus]